MSKPWKKIITFLLLTFAFSGFFYYLIIRDGKLGSFSGGLMWCPGLAAIITQLIFERSLRGLGWGFKPWKYQLVAYLTPLAYALAAYLILWLGGLGRFDPAGAQQIISQQLGLPGTMSTAVFTVVYFLVVATLVVLLAAVSALGEEIGWRGLLVPELAKVTSFTGVALISGAVWAIWHAPILLFADYNNAGAPVWFGLLCFAILVIAISFVFAWLRLKSGSLWTAVLLHAAHNAFIQQFFTPMTGPARLTPYFIDEFGLLLPLVCVALAWLAWRKRNELTESEPAMVK
jgi:membrane protease YdiL (CAAX protease family)